MNSSTKPPADARPAPFVREGGAHYEPTRSSDPIRRWMDLMEAVEALCPHWPERPPTAGTRFLL